MDHVALATSTSPTKWERIEPVPAPEMPEGAGPLDRLVAVPNGVVELTVEQPDGTRSVQLMQRGQHFLVTDGKPFMLRRAISTGIHIRGGEVSNVMRDGMLWHVARATAPSEPPRPTMSSRDWLAWNSRRRELRGAIEFRRAERDRLNAEIAQLEAALAPIEDRLRGATHG